jgi:uncharacterized protein (DUF305 family)
MVFSSAWRRVVAQKNQPLTAMEKHAHSPTQHRHSSGESGRHPNHYVRLALMAALSFVAMFILMYAMVDVFGNVVSNLNQAYMAALMTAPMIAIELIVMGMMYQNKKLNAALIVASVSVGVLCFAAIRQQALIGDKQFVRSMIPHHAGALLMCHQAALEDAELKELCRNIEESQTREIAQMKGILQRLEK